MKRGLTAVELARARELRDAGWSRERIAVEIGSTVHYVRLHLDPLPSHRTASSRAKRLQADRQLRQRTSAGVATISYEGEAR